MKITVDTKHDSKAEIQNAIALLSKLIEVEHEYIEKKKTKIKGTSAGGSAFADMFATPSKEATESGEGQEDMEESEEVEEEPVPRLEPYG